MVYFCQMIDVFFLLYNPFPAPPPPPLDPRRPLHMLYIYIMTFKCPKGILGLRGEHLKTRHQIRLFNTNITIFSMFRTHAQKEYCKVLETKGVYMPNNLLLLLLENL